MTLENFKCSAQVVQKAGLSCNFLKEIITFIQQGSNKLIKSEIIGFK